jgi:hypothetical protein
MQINRAFKTCSPTGTMRPSNTTRMKSGAAKTTTRPPNVVLKKRAGDRRWPRAKIWLKSAGCLIRHTACSKRSGGENSTRACDFQGDTRKVKKRANEDYTATERDASKSRIQYLHANEGYAATKCGTNKVRSRQTQAVLQRFLSVTRFFLTESNAISCRSCRCIGESRHFNDVGG